jgi:cytochrome c biogenesis protein CcmG/thiol:disulfide interchange protein DsbE
MSPRRTHPHSPRKSNHFLVYVAIGVFLLAAAIIIPLANAADRALAGGSLSAVPGTANYPAPELALADLEGNPAALSDYLGMVVLVNNWASWCPPCQAEMPDLQAYYAEHADEGFVIVAIDAGEGEATVRGFVERYGLTFPVWLDPGMDALYVFQNPDLPSSYVIDREGAIRLHWTGQISRRMLDRYVNPLIER